MRCVRNAETSSCGFEVSHHVETSLLRAARVVRTWAALLSCVRIGGCKCLEIQHRLCLPSAGACELQTVGARTHFVQYPRRRSVMVDVHQFTGCTAEWFIIDLHHDLLGLCQKVRQGSASMLGVLPQGVRGSSGARHRSISVTQLMGKPFWVCFLPCGDAPGYEGKLFGAQCSDQQDAALDSEHPRTPNGRDYIIRS